MALAYDNSGSNPFSSGVAKDPVVFDHVVNTADSTAVFAVLQINTSSTTTVSATCGGVAMTKLREVSNGTYMYAVFVLQNVGAGTKSISIDISAAGYGGLTTYSFTGVGTITNYSLATGTSATPSRSFTPVGSGSIMFDVVASASFQTTMSNTATDSNVIIADYQTGASAKSIGTGWKQLTGTSAGTTTWATAASAAWDIFTVELPGAPGTVTTNPATNVTLVGATLNGNVTSAGAGTITERGFVYSRRAYPQPTVGGTYSTTLPASGTTTGTYSANVSGLLEDTRYQVRAYVTTTAGTGYGVMGSFLTEATQDYLLEDGTGKYLLEDGSGYYAMDSTFRLGKQYESDNKTPIAVGASSVNGATNGIWLQYDARNGYDVNPYTSETGTLQPRFEVEAVGTAFGNTPTKVEETLFTNSDEPIGLRAGVFVYDPIRDRFIATFGANGSTSYNEVWELRLNPKGKWKKLTPQGTAPIARYQGGGVFDAKWNRVLTVFGFTSTDTNEIWELSFLNDENGTWTNRTSGISGTAPLVRSNVYQSVANDPANNRLFVFGGWGAAYRNDLWQLDYSTQTMTWTNPGANLAAGAPGIRRNAGMVYDPTGNACYVWGGAVSGTTFDTALYKFQLGTNVWSTITPTGGPPVGRELHAMWFEPNTRKFYVWGGWQGASANMQETLWEYGIVSNTWTNVSQATGSQPLGTYGTVPAYHPDLKATILWSGVDTTADIQHHVLVHDVNDDVGMLYGLQMNHAPRPMDAVSARANRDWSEALLAGGFSQMPDNTTIVQGGHVTDVFEYDYAQNFFRIATSGFKSFQHREGIMTVYDTVRDRYLFFGGLWGNGGTNIGCFNDLWEAKKNANGDYDMKRLAPTGTKPGIRWLGAAAFDEANNRMIVTCGSNGGTANYNDVWECSFASSADGVWTSRTPTGTAPTAKWGAGYSYDVAGQKLYLAGGATSAGEGTYTTQFHVLNMSTTNCAWTSLTALPGSARRTLSLTYDSVNNKAVVFGGWDNSTLYGDCYFYDVAGNTWSADVNITGEPSARRSHGSWFDLENGKIMITHGRPATGGTWFGDTLAMTPDYTTPANSTWSNRAPIWYNRASTLVRGITAATYYFNGTVTDPNATWTNDANAADGNTATDATAGGTQTFTSGYLQIAGTNAPGSGGTITSVKVRAYGGGDTNRGWGEWLQLKNPTAGWTWATLQALTARVYTTLDAAVNQTIRVAITTTGQGEMLGICQPLYYGSGTATAAHISRIELEVNTQLPTNTAYHWQYWTDAWTPVSFGANLESDYDFILGTISGGTAGYVKVYQTGAWTLKPKKVYVGGVWTIKKQKIYSGGSWIDA